ncbi:hypothetical protein [Clostridium butyricum]|nr:hypothetical protein [Clostridium butyricum]
MGYNIVAWAIFLFAYKRIMVELNRKIQSDSNKLKKEYHKLT